MHLWSETQPDSHTFHPLLLPLLTAGMKCLVIQEETAPRTIADKFPDCRQVVTWTQRVNGAIVRRDRWSRWRWRWCCFIQVRGKCVLVSQEDGGELSGASWILHAANGNMSLDWAA